MVWRRRRIRDAEAKDKACAETKIVLAPGGIHVRTDEVRHEIVDLSEAPRDVLVQYHIDAATCSKRKCILATVAGQREPAMSATKQKFRERHKVIKLAQIQTRTEQVARDSARDLVAIDVAIEMMAEQKLRAPPVQHFPASQVRRRSLWSRLPASLHCHPSAAQQAESQGTLPQLLLHTTYA